MQSRQLFAQYEKAGRRFHVVGNEDNGILIALDVEGRIFAFLDGIVLNRVNPDAIAGISTRDAYINPGGDGLWPAPEGSNLGFEYSTGSWRVPPSLTNARWQVLRQDKRSAKAAAEVDLVNASGIGLSFVMSRDMAVSAAPGTLDVTITEGIEYIGTLTYERNQAIVAPWSLCQFDCGADCTLLLPPVPDSEIRDLYNDSSASKRTKTEHGWAVSMETDFRFQLGLSPNVSQLTFIDRKRGFKVHRTAARIAQGLEYIDLADSDFRAPATGQPIRFSAYCDPSGFMEIEAAGGTPDILSLGALSNLTVTTQYTLIN